MPRMPRPMARRIEKFDADLRHRRWRDGSEQYSSYASGRRYRRQRGAIHRRRAASGSTSKGRISTCRAFDRFSWIRCHWRGAADFTLQGSGTLDAPVINAAVHVRDLTLDHELAGGLYFEADTKNGELHLTAHSDLPHGSRSLWTATSKCTEIIPRTITAQTDHVDLDALWRAYLGHQLTGHSAASGTVTMQGPMRYPRQWTLRARAATS